MRAHSRIPAIIRVVAEHYVVTPAEIRCDRYPRRFSEPRHVGMWLAEKLTDASLPEIGKAFGGRHHATVIYGIERVEARRKHAEFQEQLDALVLQIRAMPPAPCSPESLLRQLIEAKIGRAHV